MYGVGILAGFLTKLAWYILQDECMVSKCDAAMVGITASIINGPRVIQNGDVGVGEPVGFI
jgi:hypothetical protein